MIILSNGRKIHPTPEETRIEEMLPASNCCIFGDDKPYLTALIVPNGKALSREYIKTKLEEYNSGVPDEKQIKDFFISDEPFSVDNGLLTPAFKLNRKYLYQKYALEFEKLY
jgi:long-chain acyl-CoA synthetase